MRHSWNFLPSFYPSFYPFPILMSTRHVGVKFMLQERLTLIASIKRQAPKKDNQSYKSRVSKVDWNQVQFGIYTAEECKNEWNSIQAEVTIHHS